MPSHPTTATAYLKSELRLYVTSDCSLELVQKDGYMNLS